MKSRPGLIAGAASILFCAQLGLFSAAPADVSPGDPIDKTNWSELEGLVPEPVVGWVKRGDTLSMGSLSYDPRRYFMPGALRSLDGNVGKYELDREDNIIDAGTGKPPGFVEGVPFPKIDLSDPRAGTRIMYNKYYYNYSLGGYIAFAQARWIGRETGLERTIQLEEWSQPLDGDPALRSLPNPENILKYSIIRVLSPFDIAGTSNLTWRYKDSRYDSTFAYVPAIRRVRRMSPANRSDAFVGCDFCVDDSWGYDGKVNAFSWKLLRTQEALVPFVAADPHPVVLQGDGTYKTPSTIKDIVYGYEKEEYAGAPWFPTSFLWVKRPVYVLEAKSKDPYYNYGTQTLWLHRDTYQVAFKVIHDRADAYWKTVWLGESAIESPDGKIRLIVPQSMIGTDDRTDHSTVILNFGSRNAITLNVTHDLNDYSLSGFQKLCK
ncbi:MAG: DUF1329 domain-containing protein [bacterium]